MSYLLIVLSYYLLVCLSSVISLRSSSILSLYSLYTLFLFSSYSLHTRNPDEMCPCGTLRQYLRETVYEERRQSPYSSLGEEHSEYREWPNIFSQYTDVKKSWICYRRTTAIACGKKKFSGHTQDRQKWSKTA